MIHPDTYIGTTEKGVSLFAKRRFNKGEILWIKDELDVAIPLASYQAMHPSIRRKLNIYSYLDYQNRVIIPWDEGKYVNHSCNPNSTGLLEFDNISVALRDIEPHEEIVEDYYCYFGHFETFECKCGAPNCRGRVRRNNTYTPGLRVYLADIAPAMLSQKQWLLSVRSAEIQSFVQLLRRKPAMRNRAVAAGC